MQQECWIIIIVILSITLLETIAMVNLGLDGIALSATIGSLSAIAVRSNDLIYKLQQLRKKEIKWTD